MAVAEQTPYKEYIANGVTNSFPLEFDCDDQDHLIVTVNDIEIENGYWLLINGAVVFGSAPADQSKIIIQRNTPLERNTNYQTTNNSFRPQPVNKDFDRIWWKLQELWVQVTLLWAALNSKIAALWLALNQEIQDRVKSDLDIRAWVQVLLNNIVDNGLISAIAVTTVESVADLQYLVSWDGRTVYVKSYYQGLGKGGGTRIYDHARRNENDLGLCINGWVLVDYDFLTPEHFGAKGDGVTDDYEAITRCFNSVAPLPDTIYDANFQQYASKSTTFLLDDVVYRHTKPIMLPAMSDVLCKGAIYYFLDPSILIHKSRPCFYYDGDDLNVSAIHLPLYINNNNGTWSLNKNSLYIANAGDAAERSMSVGTSLRFNVITRRNTKMGVNLFGHESGEAELGVGTMGTWASDQNQASTMQSQDYNYDDLSPKCGIYVSRAWNGRLTRPRVIAHNTGLYLGRHSAGYIVEQPYINRQLDKHSDAINLQSEFLPEGIPSNKNVACGIVMSDFSGTLNNPITEHWGVPYMISKSAVTLNSPHIEGSNLIMNHNFVIYQCKVTVNGWSGIRTMYERDGTSIIYSNGMSLALGNFFELKGSGYYTDNSGFILIDSSGYNDSDNGSFLSIENIPHDKIMGVFSFSDSRHIKSIDFTSNHKYILYVDQTRSGTKKGLGISNSVALRSFGEVDEAIRLLGKNWGGFIELLSDINITVDSGISSSVNCIVNLGGKTIHANKASFLINGNLDLSFVGQGKLKATSANLFKTTSYDTKRISIQSSDSIVYETTNYLYMQDSSPFCNLTIRIQNSNLSAMSGKYANLGSSLGTVNLFVKSATRNTNYDSSPIDGENITLIAKLRN